MSKKLHWIVVLLLLLSLPALSCGLFGGDDAEEATAVPEAAPAEVEEAAPAAEPEATEAPAEDAAEVVVEEPAEEPEDAPPFSEAALSLSSVDELPFNSYRMTMVIQVTGTNPEGVEVTQGINTDMAFSKDPRAMDIVMNFFGVEEDLGNGTIEMAQVDGVSYMTIPEMGCITTSGEDLLEDNPYAEMMDPNEFMEDLNDPKYEGEETINGILTRHYSFDQFAMMGTSAEDIQSADGHIYIAKDGEYLVRMVVDATGQIDLFDSGVSDDGVFHMQIDLTDVDKPIEVTIPEACSGQDAGGSEYPMLEDAAEITSFSGMLNYQTASSLEDVVAFYDDALAADGWVKDEDGSFITGGTAMINYLRGDETLSMTVTPTDDGSNMNYVTIFGAMEQ